MTSKPTGTVTFLFTDIEGSSTLARAHPESWEVARLRHDAILREAIARAGGFIFKEIGDAFCAACHKPGDALKAALQAQRTLRDEAWSEAPIQVRMGIHTGEAERTGKDYHGYLTLSLAQRIMSAGHGGQILLSDAAEKLLRDELPQDVGLRDLGEHKFKGVPYPLRVFQVIVPDLPQAFLPLRTEDVRASNLPAQLTSFVGREKELADVKRLLDQTHLLTLVGPGGTGKTRLSIQAAGEQLDRYPDGVWLVELAPIRDPLLVPRTTAIAIGLREEPQRPVVDMLCDYLRDRQTLIILDNCEHLVDACARLADRILRAAPGVRLLASSREALGIGGEVTYRVPSLGLPDLSHLPAVESLDQYEAVRLFIDRAASAVPDFTVTNDNAPALAQICYHLDGIPLAIELAAAKIRVLSVDQIARRLDDRFRLLIGGSRTALERHQTLRAAIDWSYNLLPATEQVLFRRLAVFVGGWTLEAAEAVGAGGPVRGEEVLDLLEQLINKSLVLMEERRAGTRYQLLETIRQYAGEKLAESGENEALHDRHLEYFLGLAESAAAHLIGPEQLGWLPLLEADHENLRAALERSLSRPGAEAALNLCKNLGWFWEIRGYWYEGLNWLRRALAKPAQADSGSEKIARARALYTCAHRQFQHGEPSEQILASAEESLALAAAASDRRDTAIARYYVGLALRMRGEVDDQASALMEQSYAEFRELNDLFWQARSYARLGFQLARQGKSSFREVCLKSLELARQAGERLTLADALTDYADWLVRNNQVHAARECAAESDRLYLEIGSESTSVNAALFAEIAWSQGDTRKSQALYMELRQRCSLLGVRSYSSLCTANLGLLAIEAGALDQARAYLEDALALAREAGWKLLIAFRLAELSNLFFLQGKLEQFKRSFRECLSLKSYLARHNKLYILMTILDSLYLAGPAISARLLGAIHYAESEHDTPLRPVEKRHWKRVENRTRSALGEAAFESAFHSGQRMTLDEALDLALQTVEAITAI